MSTETEHVVEGTHAVASTTAEPHLEHELGHLRSSWCWFAALGIFLLLCGATAVTFPVITSLAAISVLGAILIIGGIAMIVGSFWAGKWSGFLINLLVGILYVVGGIAVNESPLFTTVMMTFFLAMSFIVIGAFRGGGPSYPLSTVGLGLVERRDYAPVRDRNLPASSLRRHLGHRTPGGTGDDI